MYHYSQPSIVLITFTSELKVQQSNLPIKMNPESNLQRLLPLWYSRIYSYPKVFQISVRLGILDFPGWASIWFNRVKLHLLKHSCATVECYQGVTGRHAWIWCQCVTGMQCFGINVLLEGRVTVSMCYWKAGFLYQCVTGRQGYGINVLLEGRFTMSMCYWKTGFRYQCITGRQGYGILNVLLVGTVTDSLHATSPYTVNGSCIGKQYREHRMQYRRTFSRVAGNHFSNTAISNCKK